MEEEGDKLLEEFISIGLDIEKAKQCAIKSLRQNIEELHIIDGVYWLGLKKRMDYKREMILYILNK